MPLNTDHVAADRAYRRVQLLLAPTGDEHVGALRNEELGRRQAHPGGGAGDDGDLPIELPKWLSFSDRRSIPIGWRRVDAAHAALDLRPRFRGRTASRSSTVAGAAPMAGRSPPATRAGSIRAPGCARAGTPARTRASAGGSRRATGSGPRR